MALASDETTMHPAAGTKATIADAFDGASGEYETIGPEFFELFGRALVDRAGLAPGMRVLDVGCGTGAALLPAAEAVGPTGRVLGIDLAPGMIDRVGRAVAGRGWQHVNVRLGDAEDPPVTEPELDCILAAHVLFFLPAPESALARYHQILTSGGTLAFSTWGPNDPAWKPVYQALFRHIPEGSTPTILPSRDAFSTDESITELLDDAGFTAVQHETITYDVVYASADEWLAWNRSHGARAFWDAIPTEKLPAARDDTRAALRDMVDADGRLHMVTPVRYTVAQRT
ncbi:class I SAM-dependent methyltransferase [Phytoactinopolyspora halophila]|uniref:class I SAM-dependent methyltransferase n=1 Tax=Phytoactinopolyspora halophila TaxID=1981511 RepID=UPI00131481E4|nr:methyltransferase domain-containing protein [Phytoactinopolyspora halophila]